jgi:predicted nucleic acid-binding protein
MAIYLVDTSVIIDAINGKRHRNQLLLELTEVQGHILGCCPINVAEVYAGMRPKEEARTSAILRTLRYFPLTFPIAELAGQMKFDYGKRGITLSLADAIVAATAIHNGLTLLTDNVKDFPMRELLLYPLPE